MKMPHPAPFEYIPLSHRDWIKVDTATMGGKQNWEIVQEAIDEWMRKHAPENCGEPEFAGYQWKSLFLPSGTVLRTTFKGKNHHCRVEVDQILYQGQACSPSGFVNAVGGVRRNAWKSVWLLFPDSKHWQLADTLRARKRPVVARKVSRPARPIATAPAATEPPEAPAALRAAAPVTQAAPPSPPPARTAAPAWPGGQETVGGHPQFGFPLTSPCRWTVPASP